MNYNALLLLDKHHKKKKDYSSSVLNIHQFSSNKEKYNKYINLRTKNKEKYQTVEKCYSVKPFPYIMPKDILLKDIFQQEMKTYNNAYNDISNNGCSECNNNRKQIFEKIKKIIVDKGINNEIYIRTIYLYDLICIKKENAGIKIKNKFKKFNNDSGLLIALISFILILKFNYYENKMIRVKKILNKFDDIDITLKELNEFEILFLKLIDYELTFQTPFTFLDLFLINGIVFNEDYLQSDASFNIYETTKETLENIMETSNEYFKYNYFYLCCSIISFVRDKFKINKWPKALENNFGIKFDEFHDVYRIFFQKNNEKIESNRNSKSKVRNFYNSDIINIKNLKSINNIIKVLKIMKSEDKYKRIKGKRNKIDIINDFNKDNKDETYQQDKNDNIATNSSTLSKIKVGLRKNWNLSSVNSPEKALITKSSISSMISKSNKENKNKITSIYIKRNEKKLNENIKEKTKDNNNKINTQNSSHDNISAKDGINELETINKFTLAKRFNKNKRNISLIDRRGQIYNKSFINSFKSSFDSSFTSNQKLNYINRKTQNKEIKDNNLNKSNIIIYKNSNLIKNNLANKERRTKYISKYDERNNNKDLNSDLNKNQNTTSNYLIKTFFQEFRFYRYKHNLKQEIPQINNFSKIKEENSDIPTCESSGQKLSLNEYSIRKTYRNKKNEKENKKVEKNKLYNKFKNTKISLEDNSYIRKIGVRKFYKQKNMEENK